VSSYYSYVSIDGHGCLHILGDECLALADLPPSPLLTNRMVPHFAAIVVHVMFLRAVGASLGVLASGVAVLSVLVVDVISFLAGFTLPVVVDLAVVASASTTADLAVGVDFVTELPTTGALDEVDLFGPLRESTGSMEDDEGTGGQGFDPRLIRVRDSEGHVGGG